MDTLSEQFERQNLKETLVFVEKKTREVSAVKAELDAQIAEMMEHYNSDNEELRMALVVATDMQKSQGAVLTTLARAHDSPYFGRVDFRADDEAAPERIYIGRWCAALRQRYHEEACGGFNYARAADGTTDICLAKILNEMSVDEYRHAGEMMSMLERALREGNG